MHFRRNLNGAKYVRPNRYQFAGVRYTIISYNKRYNKNIKIIIIVKTKETRIIITSVGHDLQHEQSEEDDNAHRYRDGRKVNATVGSGPGRRPMQRTRLHVRHRHHRSRGV